MKKNFVGPLIACGAFIFLAVLPIIPTLVAGMIAKANNCILNEGSSHPCVILGIDIGNDLYAMGNSFWLGILTVPVGVIGFLVSLVLLVKTFFSRNGSPKT